MTAYDHTETTGAAALVGALLTTLAVIAAVGAALLSPCLAPIAGLALVALGSTAPRRWVPRFLAVVTMIIGIALLAIGLLAFVPA